MILPYFLKGREGGHFRRSNSFLSAFVSLFLIGQRFSVTDMQNTFDDIAGYCILRDIFVPV